MTRPTKTAPSSVMKPTPAARVALLIAEKVNDKRVHIFRTLQACSWEEGKIFVFYATVYCGEKLIIFNHCIMEEDLRVKNETELSEFADRVLAAWKNYEYIEIGGGERIPLTDECNLWEFCLPTVRDDSC